MRNLSSVAYPSLSAQEREALHPVAEGHAPREIGARLDMPEESLYRLVAWVLDEVEPARPFTSTMS